MSDTQPTPAYLASLLSLLDQYFSEEELRTICFQLRVDYKTLPAEGKKNKVRELIEHMIRHERLPELITLLENDRPQVSWREESTLGIETNEYVQQRFSARPFAALIAKTGPTAGSWIFLTEQSRRIIFGRQADISIRDVKMSKKHFALIVNLVEDSELKQRNYRVDLLDLGSSNGTFLNGLRVNGTMSLQHDANIQVGGSTFVYKELPTDY